MTMVVLMVPSGCAKDESNTGPYTAGEGSDAASGDSGEAGGDASSTASSTSTSAGDGHGDGEAEAEDGADGPLLDIFDDEGTASAEGGEDDGCSKVDFLFVIDNSISMGDEQQNLTTSFPAFIQTIQTDVVDDYHVMVVDTDPEDKWDEELAECYGGDCQGEPPDEPCGILPPENSWPCGMLPVLDTCDPTFGAGVDHDGSDARNSCGITDGKRWFDDQQPDPDGTFQCIANLYDGNNPERTMDAVTAALGDPLVGPGGCNEGFLRDDAVLVVTFITDEEDDDESAGNPTVWHDTLLGLKNGNETAIVVLGLLGDTGLPGAVCPPDSVPGSNGGEYSPRLIEYVESWGIRGLWGSVCSPSYASFFEEAVALIDTACDEFIPVD